MKRQKFTLIELLLVVAIIGILVTILMPSLSNARALARQAVCLSNQRQLGVASQIYLKNNNFKMARGAEGVDYASSFGGQRNQAIPFIRLAEYLGLEEVYPNFSANARNAYYKSSEIFRCPSKEYDTSMLIDYSVNSLHFKQYYSSNRYYEGGYTAGTAPDELNWPTMYIENLGDTILFADNYRPSDSRNFYNQRTQFFSPSHMPFKNGAPNLSISGNRMMPFGDQTHRGKIVITAFDGSGKVLSIKSAGQWPSNHRLTGDWD